MRPAISPCAAWKGLATPASILGLILIAATASAQNEALRLKVMTYNIRIGVGGGEWPSKPKQFDLEPVARMIAGQQVDFAGLQEVDAHRQRTGGADQPGWLRDRLKMSMAFTPAYTVAVAGQPDEKYGVALLSRWEIESSERIALFKPDYSQSHPEFPNYFSEQRALQHSVVTVKGRPIHVFVTHLGLTVDQRIRQIEQIASTASQTPGPKILFGDFNATPDEPAMSLLRKQFKDALSEAGVSAEKRRSYPAGAQATEAIDYIFVSPEFRVLSAKVIQDAQLVSDHNPVIAELELPVTK